jgi:hypothetical protein
MRIIRDYGMTTAGKWPQYYRDVTHPRRIAGEKWGPPQLDLFLMDIQHPSLGRYVIRPILTKSSRTYHVKAFSINIYAQHIVRLRTMHVGCGTYNPSEFSRWWGQDGCAYASARLVNDVPW